VELEAELLPAELELAAVPTAEEQAAELEAELLEAVPTAVELEAELLTAVPTAEMQEAVPTATMAMEATALKLPELQSVVVLAAAKQM
jgi:hypothetical protein